MIATNKYTPPLGLAFDWETSGSTFKSYEDTVKNFQGLSLGMVVFDTTTLLPLDKKYIEIKFDETRYQWSAEAEAIHGLSRGYLEKAGMSQEDAACETIEFLLAHFGPDPKIMVLGHNIDFDVHFMEQLLEPFGLMFRLHHVRLNTSSASFIAFNTHRSNDLFEITALGERAAHNSLEDALLTLEAARRIRLLIQEGLNG